MSSPTPFTPIPSSDLLPLSSLASEDGTAKLWNLNERKTLHTLTHNHKSEVLRSSFLSDGPPLSLSLLLILCLKGVICTCGSDGNAILWKQSNPLDPSESYRKVLSLPHDDQIYSCVTSNCISSPHVITASDNILHLWDLSQSSTDNSYSISFQPLSSPLDTGDRLLLLAAAHCL